MMVQSKLTEIIKKLGVSEQEFQRSAENWSKDKEKGMQVMALQQNSLSGDLSDYADLTREEALNAFKVQLRLNMTQMDTLLKEPSMNQQPSNQFE